MFGPDSQRCHKVQRLAVIEFDLMQKHVHAGISRKITDFGGMRLARLRASLASDVLPSPYIAPTSGGSAAPL